jgi:multidrug efflux pump subunit AcrA (membrane-fusion protein)
VSAAILCLAAIPTASYAHGGQIEVGGGPKGPVTLTLAQSQALNLTLATAELRPLENLLKLNGALSVMPDAQADVSVRISGRVSSLNAKLGDLVHKGDVLAHIESRAVGDPPPTVPVKTPIDGIVDARPVIVGQAVEPNTSLFHISDRARMLVIAKAYEEDVGKVQSGQLAHIRLLAYPGTTIAGKVTLISPALDPQSRTVDIWVEIANADYRFKPDMFARADLVLGDSAAKLSIPNEAILEAAGDQFVFVREGNKYQRTDITIGASDDAFSEVTSGLVPGDEVVTQGAREVYTMWLTGASAPAAEKK